MKELEKYTALKDKTLNEIKRDFKVMTVVIIVLVILALIICFGSMKLAIDYEALNKEKQSLEELAEMQNSMITDLEENCKDLYIEIENLKFGGSIK